MSSPLVILNVNDDAATRYLLTKILRGGGHTVLEAGDGMSALRIVHAQRPDLVLLDIKLPDISGLEVCRRIKGDPSIAGTLVIQTSATYASSDRKVEGLESGADIYLAQPIDAVELLATIRAVLRTRSAEEAERKTARRLHRTFDAIQDALLLIDSQGRVEEGNGAALRLVDRTARELAGENISHVLRKVIAHEPLENLLTRVRQGRHEIETVSGERCYRLSGYPVQHDDGSSEGTVLMIADVSEEKRVARELAARVEELAEAARRKDEFLAMLAHELRNPLHAISAASNVLDQTGTPNLARPRDVIHRQVAVLARMVDDLLEVSRMTRGALELRTRTLDVAHVVRQAVQGSRLTLDARSQQLVLKLPDGPFEIEGDDLRIEQVLMNLLNNASKFSEPGSTITLELRERWDEEHRLAEISVRDEGIGIPRPMLTKIFDPFVQIDHSLARSLGGLGIGLSMAKSLIELHGGRVLARSEGLGKGSEFIVHLPAVPGVTPAVPEPVASAAEPSNGHALRVVVIEDNEDTLELVQMWLRHIGHDVQGASDGNSGLELALSAKPDVALVDIGLPGMDGYEIARSVRAADEGDDIYLVAVTGYGRPEDRARALDAGFDAYIVKPLDVAGLKSALDPNAIAQGKRKRTGGRHSSPPAPSPKS
ncbi:MAG TPA: response regulator [Polyangiales bacterium]|nr:response regulator [Polyangiales bacterium]